MLNPVFSFEPLTARRELNIKPEKKKKSLKELSTIT